MKIKKILTITFSFIFALTLSLFLSFKNDKKANASNGDFKPISYKYNYLKPSTTYENDKIYINTEEILKTTNGTTLNLSLYFGLNNDLSSFTSYQVYGGTRLCGERDGTNPCRSDIRYDWLYKNNVVGNILKTVVFMHYNNNMYVLIDFNISSDSGNIPSLENWTLLAENESYIDLSYFNNVISPDANRTFINKFTVDFGSKTNTYAYLEKTKIINNNAGVIVETTNGLVDVFKFYIPTFVGAVVATCSNLFISNGTGTAILGIIVAVAGIAIVTSLLRMGLRLLKIKRKC